MLASGTCFSLLSQQHAAAAAAFSGGSFQGHCALAGALTPCCLRRSQSSGTVGTRGAQLAECTASGTPRVASPRLGLEGPFLLLCVLAGGKSPAPGCTVWALVAVARLRLQHSSPRGSLPSAEHCLHLFPGAAVHGSACRTMSCLRGRVWPLCRARIGKCVPQSGVLSMSVQPTQAS